MSLLEWQLTFCRFLLKICLIYVCFLPLRSIYVVVGYVVFFPTLSSRWLLVSGFQKPVKKVSSLEQFFWFVIKVVSLEFVYKIQWRHYVVLWKKICILVQCFLSLNLDLFFFSRRKIFCRVGDSRYGVWFFGKNSVLNMWFPWTNVLSIFPIPDLRKNYILLLFLGAAVCPIMDFHIWFAVNKNDGKKE